MVGTCLEPRRFDYVIVGAGSAGCALASRLSENPAVSVLLIEAGGPDRHPYFTLPLAWFRAGTLARHLWDYQSEDEPALGGRNFRFVRGRVLGGTSTINGMIYARGHRRDYDSWAEGGLPDWSYDAVLPWFKAIEANWRGAGPFHGAAGPIGTSRPEVAGMHYTDWASAAAAIGIQPVEDLAGHAGEGISRMELTAAQGKRVSSATAYLRPAMDRKNLAICTGAVAERIEIDDRRAVGVLCRVGGKQVSFRANREVILSAGTYASPQLLMLSGIGPASHLRNHGIEVAADLPGVGQNLKEHVLVPVVFKSAHPATLLRELRVDRIARQLARWIIRRDGIFATNGVGANVYLRSQPGLDRPDIRLICGTLSPLAKPWWNRSPQHEFMAVVNLLHPASRGEVTLRSASPQAPPSIRFNLLTEQADSDAIARGVDWCRKLFAAEPLARHVTNELAPGVAVNGAAGLDDYIRRVASIGQHPVGTCRMGVGPQAVVDGRLRVHGIDGLRVVDASIFPDQIGGNPNVPVMMVAERAAKFICQA